MRTLIVNLAATASLVQSAPVAARVAVSPWNGTWNIDVRRSSPGAEGAAPAYRFTLRGTAITWEIPSMGEVVVGRTNGRPMVIRRHGKAHGMTLAVKAEGLATWRYRLTKDGRYFGGGLMVLVDDGDAWIDVTWGPQGPPHAAQLVYVRKK